MQFRDLVDPWEIEPAKDSYRSSLPALLRKTHLAESGNPSAAHGPVQSRFLAFPAKSDGGGPLYEFWPRDDGRARDRHSEGLGRKERRARVEVDVRRSGLVDHP